MMKIQLRRLLHREEISRLDSPKGGTFLDKEKGVRVGVIKPTQFPKGSIISYE